MANAPFAGRLAGIINPKRPDAPNKTGVQPKTANEPHEAPKIVVPGQEHRDAQEAQRLKGRRDAMANAVVSSVVQVYGAGYAAQEIAEQSYAIADAMIAESEKKAEDK